MFTGSRNIIFHGGTFVHTNASPTLEGFKILHGNIATGAFYDSLERYDPPKCHPNTRVAVLAEIMWWVQATKELEDILWLYGPAGAGKSAIAQTIAEMCAQLGLLVASFFFARASQSRNNEKCLIASIAYQLAISIPATRSNIESVVQIDPAIFDKSLDTQMEMLIIRPLVSAHAHADPVDAKQWPKLIIIDGLDECHDPSVQSSIIRTISKALRRVPVPLILLVASRPESHIRNTFNLLIKSESHTSRHIVLDNSYEPDADIKLFLLSRFNEIKENHQLAMYIPQSWPSEEIIDRLVRKSSGQFIYASTVMKYLNSPKHRPMKRLDIILGLIPIDGDMPYKELDALYNHIFSSIVDIPTILKILGFLFFKYDVGPIWVTPVFLANLLDLDKEDVDLHLSELHSILYIPPTNTTKLSIRPVHASLQDFLVDKLRSGKYYIDEEAIHTDLAQKCLRHINTSINQAPRTGVQPGSVDFYSTTSFVYHCTRASTESTNLKNDLMQIRDLRPWVGTVLILPFPDLLAWLSKADTTAREFSGHFQSLWDQCIISELNEHKFNESNIDIAGLLFLPLGWHSRWLSIISGISESQVPTILTLFNLEPDFLAAFFEDKNRSGKYHVDGVTYAHAALECLRNMINANNDEIFNPYPFIVMGFERPDARLFMSTAENMTSHGKMLIPWYPQGLKGVTTLLSKAAPLIDLYLYLRNHPLQNPAKTKVHCEHGFYSLRLAVKDYLDRCKHLVPKALRRSASCPSDLDLDFGRFQTDFERFRTFKERWPLSDNTLTRYWFEVQRMRGLPEMMALRSRAKIVSGSKVPE